MIRRQITPAEGLAAVREAETWLLTPWRHRGAVKGVCVDCGNLLIEVFASIGLIDRIDPGDYSRDWMMHNDESKFLEYVQRYAEKVDYKRPGDIALFYVGRCVSHGGIVSGETEVIHAYAPAGAVVRDTMESPIGRLCVGYWRVLTGAK